MQISNLIQEYRNIDTKTLELSLHFLGNEKELILCCDNRERQELLARKQNHLKLKETIFAF